MNSSKFKIRKNIFFIKNLYEEEDDENHPDESRDDLGKLGLSGKVKDNVESEGLLPFAQVEYT